MWEGIFGGCGAGLNLVRCCQVSAFTNQPVGWDAAAVWLVGDGACSHVRASSELHFAALRKVWRHARGREHCRGESGSALSGGSAPDSTRAEGSSIVDEPGEC